MAYKKYIKRGDKLYGPYIYHSKRVDGKVVSEYRGQKKLDYKKFVFIFLGVLILIFAVYLLSTLDRGFTGKAVLDLDAEYQEGNLLEGNIKLLLDDGEIMPSSSKLIIQNNGEDVFNKGLDELIYPEIYFTLIVLSTEESIGDGEENKSVDEESNSIGEENKSVDEEEVNRSEEFVENENEGVDENENQEVGKDENLDDNSIEETDSGITAGVFNFFLGLNPTGNVVVETEKEVQGVVSKDKPFIYELNAGQRVEIKPKSVRTNSKQLNVNEVFLENDGNGVIITTSYYEKEINLDLSEFDLFLEPGILKIIIKDQDNEIVSLTKNIEAGDSDLKEMILESPEVNKTEQDIQGDLQEKNDSFEYIDSTFELSQSEKNLLISRFGNIPTDPKEILLRNDFMIVRYELGDYWVEYSYLTNLDKDVLKIFMERDKNKWLKDVVISLSEGNEKEEKIDFDEFFNS